MIFVSDAAQFEPITGRLRANVITVYDAKSIKINIYNKFKTVSENKSAVHKKNRHFCRFFRFQPFFEKLVCVFISSGIKLVLQIIDPVVLGGIITNKYSGYIL